MYDIAAFTTDCRDFRGNVVYAAELAARLGANLSGVFQLPAQTPEWDFAPPALAAELMAIWREQIFAAERAGEAFARFAAAHGVGASAWHVAEGATIDVLENAALWHDLIVLERTPEFAWQDLGTVTLRVGVPCLVVPTEATGARFDTIAIAWNGSPEAARALHAAMPLLRLAARRVLIDGSASAPTVARCWDPARDVAAYLAEYDLPVTRLRIAADGAHAGEELLALAANASADLLVMGAWGRTRFSEWIFGGATRHVLAQARLPVLLHH